MPGSNEESNGGAKDSNGPPKMAAEFQLENSSLWWLTLDFFQHPGNVLLMSSFPLCIGAYYGYKQPGANLEEWVGDVPTESKSSAGRSNRVAQKAMQREAEIMASRQLGLQVASRALGVATIGTIGIFGILGAAGFYASGCTSIEEAMMRTRRWASSRSRSFEDWLGLEERESKTHPEVVAAKGMTEDEELQFVYDRLMKEIETDEDSTKR